MKSYCVKMLSEGKNLEAIRVEITVEGYDEADAKDKAVAYLRRVYIQRDWQAIGIAEVTGPQKRGARRPLVHLKRRR
jgi:hypothetical protein